MYNLSICNYISINTYGPHDLWQVFFFFGWATVNLNYLIETML